MVAGDPPSRYHPTAWAGRLMARIAILARAGGRRAERTGGVLLVAVPCCAGVAAILAIFWTLDALGGIAGTVATIAAGAVLLKSTIAVRGLEVHAAGVAHAIREGNIDAARGRLAGIVKRDTSRLDADHIVSGAVESVSENTVDGVTGPLFYFGILGVPGAFVHRMVSTADSMVGYRNGMFSEIGRFAAGCDTILNYIPARITGAVTVLASALLGMDWRGSYRIMARDGRKTESRNSGYPMAAAAGALGVQLEKPGHYTLGDGAGAMSAGRIGDAVRLMKLTSAMFCCVVTVPLVIALSYLGWWIGV